MEIKDKPVSHIDISKADTVYTVNESVSGNTKVVMSGTPITPIDALIGYLKQDSAGLDNDVWNWDFEVRLIKTRR